MLPKVQSAARHYEQRNSFYGSSHEMILVAWQKQYMYRVFQNKLHKVCHVINFEPFVLGLWC